ncbi:MAG: polyphosphate polymerase domain-containing protein [Treponema sp.]|nr:polyphosphate polymerase domain-containing protein [Treponema sp.]
MQNFFKRHEKKYLITQDQAAALQNIISQRMNKDPQYLVQNLYYDSGNWDIIRKSIEKPFYKEKLRLRLYGLYSTDSQAFIELKKKYDGITYKRRAAVPVMEIKNRSIGEIINSSDSQIHREIAFFLKNNTVSEKVYIAFRRTAYTGIKESDLRITFDNDILFTLCPRNKCCFDGFNPGNGRRILKPSQSLLEIKTAISMPFWLARALSEKSIFPSSFSKYGVCYAKHIAGGKDCFQFVNKGEEKDAA